MCTLDGLTGVWIDYRDMIDYTGKRRDFLRLLRAKALSLAACECACTPCFVAAAGW